MRLLAALGALLVATCLACADPPAAPAQRPNIVFILADDHAAHAVSAYGSTINRTPHIDRLAAEGVRFEHCFATNAICTPSRASIITGQYSHVNGVPAFNRFDASRATIAKHLHEAGYATALFGKWHLGSDPAGFDTWKILPGQGVYVNPSFTSPSGTDRFEGHVTELTTRFAIDWLRTRPKDRPFFLCVHHKAPHRSWVPDAANAARWKDRDIPLPATFDDDFATRCAASREADMGVVGHLTNYDLKIPAPAGASPEERRRWDNTVPKQIVLELPSGPFVLRGVDAARWKYERYMRDYLACVQGVDDSVGAILAELAAQGLERDTIVVYTSDQGFFLGDHGWFDKRFMYEESIRMPLLVRWPGVATPGLVQGAMALNVDFAPTFLEAAGLPIPTEIQGKSLVPLIAGRTPSGWRDVMYYRYYDDGGEHKVAQHYGIRTDRWKLIRFQAADGTGQPCVELFDLAADPHELKNLADDPAFAATRAELEARLEALKREVGDNDPWGPAGKGRPKNDL